MATVCISKIKPGGTKLWRFRYLFGGRENMLAFGVYPAVSLADARTKREEARKALAAGLVSSLKRKQDKVATSILAANTFGAIADELLANKQDSNAAEATLGKNLWLPKTLPRHCLLGRFQS
jgi:Arm DNA-binding domain